MSEVERIAAVQELTGAVWFVPNDDFASPRVNVRFREYLEGD
jgi:hypothetical protein